MSKKHYLSLFSLLFLFCFMSVGYASTAAGGLVITNVSPVSVCVGDDLTLTTTGGADTYEWFKDGVSLGAGTDTYSFTSLTVADAGMYFAITVDTASASIDTSNTVEIVVNTNPTAAFTYAPICLPGAATFEDASTGGPSDWNWSFGDGATAMGDTVMHTYAATGTYTVTFDIKTVEGCVDTLVMDVEVFPELTVFLGPDLEICSNGEYLTPGAGYASYTWSDATTGSSLLVNAVGTYGVTVTDANGCAASDDVAVTSVVASPDASIIPSGNVAFCAGGSINLDGWQAGILAWEWSNGLSTSNIDVSTAGTYSVIIHNANNCTDTSDVVTVSENPLPTVDLGADQSTCEGTPVTFDAGAGFAAYSWSTGFSTQAVDVSFGGLYAVTVTDVNGCVNADTAFLTISANPNLDIGFGMEFCDGGSVSYDAGAGFSTYAWSSGESTQTLDVTTSGSYSVAVTDADGCSWSSNSVTVTVFENPATPTITTDGTTLTSSTGAGYQWFAEGIELSGATSQTYSPSNSGTFSVEVTDVNGCSAMSADEFFNADFTADNIPTGFSPNGDGINDVLEIPAIEFYGTNNIKIFNRWGNLVYEADGYNNEFDGNSSKGGQGRLTDGTYFYILDLDGDGGRDPFTGHITINR